MCYMNWEVLLAVFIWDFTCVENCSECVLYGLVSHSGEATPTEWFSSLIVNGCGFLSILLYVVTLLWVF